MRFRHGSFERAQKWFNEIIDGLASLQDMPRRRPAADESEELGREVRFLLHGRRNHLYKVYFSVPEKTWASGTVQVLPVRHWARRGIAAHELEELLEAAPPEQNARS